MQESFDQRMVTKFPLLYRDRFSSVKNTCMAFGFEIGPGWYGIVEEASEKLEFLIEKYISEYNPQACVCGENKSDHENFNGKCIKKYQIPLKFKSINKWGHFSVPGKVYDSKKLNDRIYVFWRNIKSFITRKFNHILWLLCNHKILYETIDSWCKEFRLEHPAASQIKEKFGGLRFYLTSGTEEMYKICSEAESKSYKTCEQCGNPGKVRDGGWILTLCDSCHSRDHK